MSPNFLNPLAIWWTLACSHQETCDRRLLGRLRILVVDSSTRPGPGIRPGTRLLPIARGPGRRRARAHYFPSDFGVRGQRTGEAGFSLPSCLRTATQAQTDLLLLSLRHLARHADVQLQPEVRSNSPGLPHKTISWGGGGSAGSEQDHRATTKAAQTRALAAPALQGTRPRRRQSCDEFAPNFAARRATACFKNRVLATRGPA